MADIAFHFNAPDKLAYACRLLRKAVGSGARVVVAAPSAVLDRLDPLLWTFSQIDFVAHTRLPASEQLVTASPVVLSEAADPQTALPHRQVLVNLGEDVPAGFETFERVIEIVGQEEGDRQLARGRWKHYSELGYDIIRHDLNLKGAG